MPLFKFLRMDRLRRSLRDSFRKKKDHVPECSKPHQWQADEAGVRAGTCNFSVKYLGCVEVFESRGMQVCEEALKMLRNSRRRPVKGILYVTGDGLRVVDDETKGLIVDQTIEKVSFCAPDRNHEKGFSYICRDGTTRRWMCHGFLAVKDSGERLSHAVGCAFAACLERKQKRDKECGVTMTFDHNNSTFTRLGSFRQSTMTERMDSSSIINTATGASAVAATAGVVGTAGANTSELGASPLTTRPHLQLQMETSSSPANSILPPLLSSTNLNNSSMAVTTVGTAAAPITATTTKTQPSGNPYAVERPHATPFMLQRQGSFRGFTQLNQTSPFKRQLSLRLNDLPSNLERHQRSLEPSDSPVSPVSPIPESSPVAEKQQADSISAMCQQVARGLSLLSSSDDPFSPTFGSPPTSAPAALPTQQPIMRNGIELRETNPWLSSGSVGGEGNSLSGLSRGEMWLATNVPSNTTNDVVVASSSPNIKSVIAQSQVTKSASNPLDLFGSQFNGTHQHHQQQPPPPLRLGQPQQQAMAPPRRAPHIAHLRSQSLGAAVDPTSRINPPQTVPSATPSSWAVFNGSGSSTTSSPAKVVTATTTPTTLRPVPTTLRDPFDADWATLATSKPLPSTNPFAQGSAVKTFEIHM